MRIFGTASLQQYSWAMFLIRVCAGLTMAAHGWQKVFVIGMGVMADNFAKMGIPFPAVAGPFISLLELIGGVLLAVGFLTRPVALLLAIDMLVAAVHVHLPSGFFAPKGAELVVLLFAMYAALVVAGGGSPSVDALMAESAERSS